MGVAEPGNVGLPELADMVMEVEDPEDVGVDMAELVNKEVDVVELDDMGK